MIGIYMLCIALDFRAISGSEGHRSCSRLEEYEHSPGSKYPSFQEENPQPRVIQLRQSLHQSSHKETQTLPILFFIAFVCVATPFHEVYQQVSRTRHSNKTKTFYWSPSCETRKNGIILLIIIIRGG